MTLSPRSDKGNVDERDVKRRRVAATSASHQADIAAHYNNIVQKPLAERGNSTIIGLRNFNNWIKSVLIDQYCTQPPHLSVLDICGGKGGDLKKYKVARIGRYVLADHASQSVRDAVERFNSRGIDAPFPALFVAADCHRARLSDAFDVDTWFDTVSCQFALHYSFESETRARDFLYNVSERLKPGGHFIATFPNADVLVRRLRESHSLIAVKNSICTVRFAEPSDTDMHSDDQSFIDNSSLPPSSTTTTSTIDHFSANQPFGLKYWFNLTDAIDDCPEYLVHLPTLINLASLYGLSCVYARGLHAIFHDYVNNEKYSKLLRLMRVVDGEGRFGSVSVDEWETLNLYQGVVFRKMTPSEFANGDRPRLYTEPPPSFTGANSGKSACMKRNVGVSDIRELKPQTESFTARILTDYINSRRDAGSSDP